MTSTEWEETKIILHELEQLFHREDDIKDILDIKKMEKEIVSQCNHRVRDVREIIKAMTTMVEAKEKDIIAPTQTEHLAKLREISEKENVHEQIEHLVKAIDAKKSNILKLQAANQQLQDRAHEYTLTSAMADSRTAYAISLYSKISNITWNYAADNSHLAGCIGNDAKKEFKEFDIDVSKLSSFEVASQLWDLVGEALDAE